MRNEFSILKDEAGSILVVAVMVLVLLTIIVFKLITKTHWEMPKGFNFVLQVALGIMVGASFQPAMLPVLKKLFFPVSLPFSRCSILSSTRDRMAFRNSIRALFM